MRVLNNESLSKNCTFHVGGIAHNFYIPETVEELCMLTEKLNGEEYHILSGGSNVLISDKHAFEHIISMKEVCKDWVDYGNGIFYVGASNRIQKVIQDVNECGYGGFEELVGLPALFGGIIYMNAGIGGKKRQKFNISDFVTRVKAIHRETQEIVWVKQTDCKFGYRQSVFQNNDYIILGAEIKLQKQENSVSKDRINKRKEFIKANQEWGAGTFGTCFSEGNGKILNLVSKLFPHRGDVFFARNNSKWFVNHGNATFDDTMYLIRKCMTFHKILGQKIICEIRIWH